MNEIHIRQTIEQRFPMQRPPITFLAKTNLPAPITFSHLRSPDVGYLRSGHVEQENAFSIQMMLAPLGPSETWINGKHRNNEPANIGDAFLFDLTANPICGLNSACEMMRFYIHQDTLDAISYERSMGRVSGLMTKNDRSNDPVLHSLALSILAAHSLYGSANALFNDYIALAFHAHIVQYYGNLPDASSSKQGGLAPWQLRRAFGLMEDKMAGDPTVAELASECGVSDSHFARAFRRSVGVAPHQWLTAKRIERAKEYLLIADFPISEIALTCGFSDQSHFTRVFTRTESCTPARWRRMRLN